AAVRFRADGKALGSGSGLLRPGDIKLWDARTGQERATLQGHTGPFSSVAFSPDGKTLASASGAGLDPQGKPLPGEIKLWDPQTGQERATLRGHTTPVLSVCFSPD